MEASGNGSPGNLQLFEGDFQFFPSGNRGRNRGQITACLPQSGRVRATLARDRGRVSESGLEPGRVILPAECEEQYYEQVAGTAVAVGSN